MRKLKLLDWFFPAVTIITIATMITALGIIHWNRMNLSLCQDVKDDIQKKKQELAAITEQLNNLKENITFYSQKKIDAQKAIRESEEATAKLTMAKIDAEGVIASADRAAQNEKNATKELNTITEQVKLLKDQLANLEKTILEKQTEFTNISTKLADAQITQNALLEQKAELAALKKEAELLKRNVKTLSAQCASIQELEKNATQSLNKISEEEKILKDKLAALEKTILEKQTELNKISTELTDSQNTADTLQSQKAELVVLQKEAELLKRNVKTLSAQCASAQEMEKNALTAESESKKQLKLLKEEIAQANLQLAGFGEKQKQFAELGLRIADSKKALEVLRDEIDAIRKEKADLAAIQGEAVRLSAENKTFKEQNQKLALEQKALETKNTAYSENLLKQQEALSALELQIANAQKMIAENSSAQSEALRLKTEIDNLKEQNQKLVLEQKTLETKNKGYSENLLKQQKALSALELQIANAQKMIAENSSAQSEALRLKTEIDNLKEQNQKLVLEQKTLETKNKGYSENLLKQQQSLAALDLQIEDAKKKIAEQQKSLNDLSQKQILLSQMEELFIQKQAEIQKLQEAYNQQKAAVEALQKQRNALQKQLAESQISEELNLKTKTEVMQNENLLKRLKKEIEENDSTQKKLTREVAALLEQKKVLLEEVAPLAEQNEQLKKVQAALTIAQEQLLSAKHELRQAQEQTTIQNKLQEQNYKDFSAKKVDLEVQIKQLEARLQEMSKTTKEGNK